MSRLALLLLVACAGSSTDTDTDTPDGADLDVTCERVRSGYGDDGAVALNVEEVASGLEIPWSIVWLPDGAMLVSERTGAIRRVEADGTVVDTPVADVPITPSGEGGLLGLALHPDFSSNRWLYVYYTLRSGNGVVNQVERWVVSEDGTSATADRVIVADIPALQFHNGGRIRFGPDGHLYVGTGDAGIPDLSQDPESLAGKLLRVTDEGEIPDDNPWGTAAWVIGIRNLQAFDWRDDGRILLADHGPSGLPAENGWEGHDEVNIAEPGDNLGWPDIYRCQEEEGLRPPSMTWQDALPPGGAAIDPGSAVPDWAGSFLVGVLGFGDDIGHLHRVTFSDDGNVETSEVYLQGEYGRMRDVVVGPDGALYVTTSNCDGRATCPAPGDRILRITAP
jgi:glucose/arabinose dehydrogenase